MMRTIPGAIAAAVLLVSPALAADPYSVKEVDKAPPKELDESIRKLLPAKAVEFRDGKGKVLAELWFRKEVPAKATEQQLKNGVTYQEVPQTTVLGAVRLATEGSDYRKQKIKPGVYTLRLAYQPMDGDHMGTAPFVEFVLLAPAAADKKPDTMKPEDLQELSLKASGTGHPAIWLLFPVDKGDLGKPPALAKKIQEHWVLTLTRDVTVDGEKKGSIGIGLTLVGASPDA